MTGTSGNDTFVGDNVSTSAGDTLTGGLGTDTLKVFADGDIPNISGIENVYYNNPGADLNFASKADVLAIELSNVDVNGAARALTVGSQAITLSSIADSGNSGNDIDINADASVTSHSLTLNGVGSSTGNDVEIDVNGAGVTSLGIAASSNASNVTLINTGAKINSVTMTGDKVVKLTTALATITTLNASATTGNVTIGGIGASNLAFTGGSGNDKIVMAATVTAADVLKGGTGTDTLSVSDADTIDTAAEVVGITEFEVLEAAGTDATAYNLSIIGVKNTISGLVISATGGDVTASNLNAATAGNITINGDAPGTVTLTAADFVAGGTSDTATIKIDNSVVKSANGVDITSLVFSNADVLNLQSLGDGSSTKVSGGAEENSVALTATDVEKVVITGDEALAFSTAAGTLPTEIDASGMTNSAAVMIDTDASAIVSLLVKGSSKNDTIDTDNAATKTNTLYTGGGSDTVVIQGASDAASTMIFTATALNAGDLKAGDATTVTLTGASAGATVTINLTSTLEGLLKSGGTLLSATTGNINIHGTALSATTNVAAAQAGGNMVLQFDLNGDGAYAATDDAQITLVGTGTDDTLVYNAANDYFLFTVV